MILLDNLTIPASFQKLDSRVTDADQCANVRDIQRVVLNHNILLARRARRNNYAADFEAADYRFFTITPYISSFPPVVDSGLLLFSQLSQVIRFQFLASRTQANPTANPEIGVYIWLPGQMEKLPGTEDQIQTSAISAASGSEAWTTIDCPVPYKSAVDAAALNMHGGKLLIGYKIYVLSRLNIDSTVYTGQTLNDVGPDFVRVANSISLFRGHSVEIDGLDIPPSMIYGSPIIFGASDKKSYIYPAFTREVSLSETVTARTICGVNVIAMSVFDLTVDAFDAAQAAL